MMTSPGCNVVLWDKKLTSVATSKTSKLYGHQYPVYPKKKKKTTYSYH